MYLPEKRFVFQRDNIFWKHNVSSGDRMCHPMSLATKTDRMTDMSLHARWSILVQHRLYMKIIDSANTKQAIT